jgi:uncharacterized membrane protein YidH (DUF202 family)
MEYECASPKEFNMPKTVLIMGKDLKEAVRTSNTSSGGGKEFQGSKSPLKHELLLSLAEYYGCPFVEYDEGITAPAAVMRALDTEKLKKTLWFPISVYSGRAEVIACSPDSADLIEEIKKTLGVKSVVFRVALPEDLLRIIEHNQDINNEFPSAAGRTQLAKVRTFLANRRSMLASFRNQLARGRTGLAFFRTGLSFITIAILLFKIFKVGYSTPVELALLVAGIVMSADGLLWYVPTRGIARKGLNIISLPESKGITVLTVSDPEGEYFFTRTGPVEGAEELRAGWSDLSPVMKRRFLANDRTDLAGERTTLAFYRTLMSKARTGLALARTGIALLGVGIALLRHIYAGKSNIFDLSLIFVGIVMVFEGVYWYFPGRRAGKESLTNQMQAESKRGIWDYILPPVYRQPLCNIRQTVPPPIKMSHAPGVWGTTGLALERTLLAERRNVMARIRTTMARSRTGLGFIRTGMNFSAVGIGLLVSLGISNSAWTILEIVILAIGVILVADGLYWHIPAEKIRRQFPYCFGEIEIASPDYSKPVRLWGRVVFRHVYDE